VKRPNNERGPGTKPRDLDQMTSSTTGIPRSEDSRSDDWEDRLAATEAMIAAGIGKPPADIERFDEACKTANERTKAFGEAAGLELAESDLDERQRLYLTTGVLDCRPCRHAAGGIAAVILGARRALCAECLADMDGVLIRVPEDCCDLCHRPAPGHRFWPIAAQWGPLIVGGNICRPCAEVLDCPDLDDEPDPLDGLLWEAS
jgi:hypothetical protein